MATRILCISVVVVSGLVPLEGVARPRGSSSAGRWAPWRTRCLPLRHVTNRGTIRHRVYRGKALLRRRVRAIGWCSGPKKLPDRNRGRAEEDDGIGSRVDPAPEAGSVTPTPAQGGKRRGRNLWNHAWRLAVDLFDGLPDPLAEPP